MADSKVSALSTIATPADEDLVYLVDDPAGTPASGKSSLAGISSAVTRRASYGSAFTPPVNGDFSWVSQDSATVGATNGGIRLYNPINNGWALRVKTAPSTPYTITACFLARLIATNSQNAGLVFRQSSDGKFVAVTYAGTTNDFFFYSVDNWTDPSTYSSTPTTRLRAIPSTLVWLRITDNGTNRLASYSHDGVNFAQYHTVGRTDFLTADQVGFAIRESTNSVDCEMTLLSWVES